MAAVLNLVDTWDTKNKVWIQQLGINKGEDYRRTITLYQDEAKTLPVDLTGFEAHAQLKVTATDVTPIATFQCLFNIDRTDGVIHLVLARADSTAIPTKGRTYADKTTLTWDMEIGPTGGDKMRLYNGIAEVSPEVTGD